MSKYTPLRVALAFCCGILLSLKFSLVAMTPVLICLGSLFGLYIFSVVILRFNYKFRWIQGALAFMALITSGMSMPGILHVNHSRQDDFIQRYSHEPWKIFILMDKPVLKSAGYSARATLAGFMDTIQEIKVIRANVLIYLSGDISAGDLMPGDMILARCDIREVDGPQNPGAFDYRKYLYYRNIRWKAFIDESGWKRILDGRITGIRSWAAESRKRFRDLLKAYHIEGEELALASALILGSTDLLDRETMQEFSNAGAVHVLSVSGLHVGIMYVLADRVLFLLKRSRLGRKIQPFLIICLIWAYAVLTGLPSSVVRASLMFSLISVSIMMNRDQDGFNILAAALFFQLWLNPFEMTQLGLQLSYLAVMGIFVFYKPINHIFSGSNRIVAWIWSVVAVSVSAQVATFPLTTYYFHFFPSYFLITNLIVVPLAAIIVYLALIVLLAGLSDIPFDWLGYPLKWMLSLMHGSVSEIQSWPGAVVQNLYITDNQAWLLYLAIAGLFLFFIQRERTGLWILLSSLTLVIVISGIQNHRRSGSQAIIIYAIRNHSATDLIHDRKTIFLADSSLLLSPGILNNQVIPGRIRYGIRQIITIDAESHSEYSEKDAWICRPFAYFRGISIAFLDDAWPDVSVPGSPGICVDMALISGRYAPDPDKILKQVKISEVVIDGSVPVYQAKRWENACLRYAVPCHHVLREGAYVRHW